MSKPPPPKDAQTERAEQIREQIRRLRDPETKREPPRSPHEFIEEQMQEDDES